MGSHTQSSRPSSIGRTFQAFALTALITLFSVPAVHAGDPDYMPADYPQELRLPFSVPCVFLTGMEQIVTGDGQVEVAARTFEFSRGNTHDAELLLAHYIDLFNRTGWDGRLEQSGESSHGEFRKDGISVSLTLCQQAAKKRFTMKVRVDYRYDPRSTVNQEMASAQEASSAQVAPPPLP